MKRIIGAVIILALFGYTIYSVLDTSSTAKSDQHSTSEAPEGSAMTPPNAPKGLKVGEEAPDVQLETLEGEKVHLSDFKGQKVYLNFWATWCPPCREEMPEMQQFHEEYGEEVTIIAVNATATETGGRDKIAQYVKENGYTFKVLLDPNNDANSLFRAQALPTTYFIGTDGTIQQAPKVGPMNMSYMKEMKEKLK